MTVEDLLEELRHVPATACVVVTPELREALVQHKADLLPLLAPVTEFVILRGGPAVPLPAVHLALDLERRRFRQTVDDDGTYRVEPAAALTDADRAAIRRWRRHLAAILSYECPSGELTQ